MTIFRVHESDDYLAFLIPSQEVLDKLGRSHPIHIDHSPISYASVWPSEFQIAFRSPIERQAETVPDISISGGKLFLSQHAYAVLKDCLERCGEFLPVMYENGTGVIFNPLVTADDKSAVDDARVSFDRHGNLTSFGFKENLMGLVPLFRTELDAYTGVFCNEELKDLIEGSNLTGVYFCSDVASPTGEPYGTSH